jgi:hypothetical protein
LGGESIPINEAKGSPKRQKKNLEHKEMENLMI